MLSDKQKKYLADVIEDEIISYLDSGYKASDDYVQMLMSIMNTLGLKISDRLQRWLND